MKKLLFVFTLCTLLAIPMASWTASWTVVAQTTSIDMTGGTASGKIISYNGTPVTDPDIFWNVSTTDGTTFNWEIKNNIGGSIVTLISGTGTGSLVGDQVSGNLTATTAEGLSAYGIPDISWSASNPGTFSGTFTFNPTNNKYTGNVTINSPSVPEPMSIILGIMGLGSIAGFKKFRK